MVWQRERLETDGFVFWLVVVSVEFWPAKVTGFGFKLKQRYVVFLRCREAGAFFCRFPLFSGRDQRGQLGGRFSVCFVVQRVFWLAKGTVCWERAVSVANCRGRQQSGCF